MTSFARSLGLFIAAYALWLFAGALAVLIIPLARSLILRADVVFGWGPWLLGALDKFGVLIMALGWLVWMIYTEMQFRTAIPYGWRRLIRVSARTLLAVGVADGLLALAIRLLRA